MNKNNPKKETPIYLDYNATTPIDAQVAEAMLPYIHSRFGNPSSTHQFGINAKTAIENAREQVADMLGCKHDEIIFTSGGTEANNIAIKGYLQENREKGNHIITSAVEHPAVLEVCRALKNEGYALTVLPVDNLGRIDPRDVESAIRENTAMITIMHANNEVGTIQPIQTIANIAHSHNIAVHTDAAQSIGKISVNVYQLDVDMLSIAGHKLYAPKGVGALYVRRGINLKKLFQGANHERNLRPGTENVLGIVGLGKACQLVFENIETYWVHYASMRDMLERGLLDTDLEIRINGDKNHRLPNTSSISFYEKKANEIIEALPGVAVSAGAACHAENVSISHVLQAMRIPDKYTQGTIRFSTGRDTNKKEISHTVQVIRGTLIN